MAQGILFVCTHCAHLIESWDEGNPYYLDEKGEKHYAYHPFHELRARCIGNDSPVLCLACAGEFVVDSQRPIALCPKCQSSSIVDTWHLESKPCPFCKAGNFERDPTFCAIS